MYGIAQERVTSAVHIAEGDDAQKFSIDLSIYHRFLHRQHSLRIATFNAAPG